MITKYPWVKFLFIYIIYIIYQIKNLDIYIL